ncbi:Similar to Grik4: Glutamate receptor ionotropic [Cotesia congregata]|uniref:Kainate 4 (Mus musculus) n=1 Tax=Cotesia congregata TaxID=51543 RepID=A0A8J2HGX9_COTCN|nr:Similar to Grik4: Glutamate receptor ionotropic [Cotesia congregata]
MIFLCPEYREIIIVVIMKVILSSSSQSQSCSLDYRPLVLSLNNEYQTSGILFTSSKNYLSVINYNELTTEIEYYESKISRPLLVFVINEEQDLIILETLSKTIDMNYPVWLIIFTGSSKNNSMCDYCLNTSVNELSLSFRTEMIVWCCCDPNYLHEWWSIDGNNFQKSYFGNWSYETGVQGVDRNSLFAIRSAVNAPLRIAYVTNSVFFKYKNGKMSAFMGDILSELTKTLNITPLMKSESIFGIYNEDEKTWTGMVGSVWRRDVDMGVGEVTMTVERREILDFTLPLILSPCRLYFREPNSTLQWSAYFEAFSSDIWMIMISMIVLIPALITLIKIHQSKKMISHIITENYLNVWGIFCQQGLSEFPARTSLRIVYFAMLVSAFILSAAYSAALISFLAVSEDKLPFSSLDEFVCIEKAAFYASDAMRMSMNNTFPCDITYIETGRYDSLAMVLPHKSPYTGIFNHQIHKFRDRGILNKFIQKHFNKKETKINTYTAVTIRGVAPILVVFTGGITFAIILLVIEKVIFFYARYTATMRSGSVTPINVQHFQHSFSFKVKGHNNFINGTTKVNNDNDKFLFPLKNYYP